MSDTSTWSTVAAENNAQSPDGFPEGMVAGGLNNSSREVMAAVARRAEAPDWVGYDDTPVYASADSFTIAGDVTDVYQPARRCRVFDDEWHTGTIKSSIFEATDTTIVVTRDPGTPDYTAGMSAIEVGILSTTTRSYLDNHLSGTFTGLRVERSNPYRIEIDADQILLGGAGGSIRVLGVDTYARLDQSGANGLDTGAEQPSTWYYVYVIWGNGQTAGLLSEAPFNPVIPASFTHSALVSAVYNDPSADLYDYSQKERSVAYRGGNYGVGAVITPNTWAAAGLPALVPPIAIEARLTLSGQGETLAAAPFSNGIGGFYSLNAISTTQRNFGGALLNAYHAASGAILWNNGCYVFSETATFNINVTGWGF